MADIDRSVLRMFSGTIL